MRRAVRRIVRVIAFFLLRVSRFGERMSRNLAVATFTRAEIYQLAIAEWEAFGVRGTPIEAQLFAWESALFAAQIHPGDSVLVVGAGTGRDVMPLLEARHQVTALDIAPRTLEQLRAKAAERGFDVRTVTGSIATVELAPRSFDVVYFSWFCFGYLHGPAERRAALENSAASLRPGGRILLSYAVADRPDARPSRLLSRLARLLGGIEVENVHDFTVAGSAARPSVFYLHNFEPREVVEAARDAELTLEFPAGPASWVGVATLTRREEAAQ